MDDGGYPVSVADTKLLDIIKMQHDEIKTIRDIIKLQTESIKTMNDMIKILNKKVFGA